MAPASVDPYAPDTVAVYRLYDANGQLLYVGQSRNPKARFITHAREVDWWEEVAHWAVEWWSDRYAARTQEQLLIAELSPRYNIAHAPLVVRARRPRRPDGAIGDVLLAMREEACVRTVVVLGRLASHNPDLYDEWTPGDLKAFLRSFGVEVRKRLTGQSCLVLEEVQTAFREHATDLPPRRVSAGQWGEAS
jgi:hypothetical protein